jgi:sugar O-acyltransferase (sialic acid O-acetyltransferase NeuD family)
MGQQRIILIGGGGHASVCLDSLSASGVFNIVGIVDSLAPVGSSILGLECLGRQEEMNELAVRYDLHGFFIGIGDNVLRKRVYEQVSALCPKLEWVNAIHPSAVVSASVEMGSGNAVMAGTVINAGCSLGNGCVVNTNSCLEHDSTMNHYSFLGSGSVTGAKVHIGELSMVSMGVVISDRLTIGRNSMVGLGSVVVKHVEENSLVYGAPARWVRARSEGDKFLA